MKQFYKYAIIVLIVISVTGYYLSQQAEALGLAKPQLTLKVSTNSSQQFGGPMINNITFERSSVPFFYKTTDTPPDFPDVQALVRINRIDAAPGSYWASEQFKGESIYMLPIFFRPGKEPKKGDVLLITVSITSNWGDDLYRTTAFYVWE